MKFSGPGNITLKEFFKHYKKSNIKKNPTPQQIFEAKKLAQELMRHRKFTVWEEKVKMKLNKSGLKFEEKFRKFPLYLDHQSHFEYVPDFILKDVHYKNKKILVEAHEDFTEQDAIKYGLFMDKYGETYYLIMVVKSEQLWKWNEYDNKTHPLFHDIWTIDDLDDFIQNLRFKIRSSGEIELPENAKCPLPKGCGREAHGRKDVEKVFGYRKMKNGKIIVQSYCRLCRSGKHKSNTEENLEIIQKYDKPKKVFCTGCGNSFVTSDPSQSHCKNCLKVFEK